VIKFVTEILLNVALNTINLTLNVCTKILMQLQLLNGVFKLITPHFIETSFNIMWSRLSVTCDRSVVFSGSSGFLNTPFTNWSCINTLVHTFWVGFMVFNATFKSISVILWQSVLLVEEFGEPVENHRPAASHWQTSSTNVASSTPRLKKKTEVLTRLVKRTEQQSNKVTK
jgi:hypothetical protein